MQSIIKPVEWRPSQSRQEAPEAELDSLMHTTISPESVGGGELSLIV